MRAALIFAVFSFYVIIIRDSEKPILLQGQIFGCDCVKLAQNDFHRSFTTAQIILLIFLVSLKNPTFRDEKVLSLSLINS